MNLSGVAKILLAVNGIFLAALADPTIAALIAAHPKTAAIVAVVSNLAHLISDAVKKQ
jgi:hypothetical protein